MIKYYIDGSRYPIMDRDPELYYYDIRDREGQDFSIEKHVLVNHIGTMITNEELEEIKTKGILFSEDLYKMTKDNLIREVFSINQLKGG